MRSVLDISLIGAGVEVRSEGEVIRIEPWGDDSLRVRAALERIESDLPGALEEAPASGKVTIGSGDGWVSIANGAITAVVESVADDGGHYVIKIGRAHV